MKNLYILLLIIVTSISCNSSKQTIQKEATANLIENDTIKISGPNLEYDIIIIEPGFNYWLKSVAKPEGYYNQSYLENKNTFYVSEWNNRVNQPSRHSQNLYEMAINYQSGTDYGYEVNYKLYNYFIYFQNTYKQNLLGGRVPIN